MAENNINSGLSPLVRLLRLLRAYRREIRHILLYAVVSGLISLSLPLGIQAIIGLIAGGSISASWGVLVFFVVTGALLTALLRLMQLSIAEHVQRKLFSTIALDFAMRLPRIHLERMEKEYLPEWVNRFFDVMNLQKGLPKLLIDGLTGIISIVFSLTLLSFYHPSFVTFSLMLLLLLSVFFYFTAPRGLQTSLIESKYKYKLAFWLEEVGRVASTFKLAGENQFPVQRADELTSSYLDARGKHWRILLEQFFSGIVFRVLVVAGFLILGSLLVMNNEINLGQFVAAEILVLFVVDSVDKLILLLETLYDVLTSTEKIGQVGDLPIEREDGAKVEEFCQHEQALSVELRNLSYTFPNENSPSLNKLNLVIKHGERVAITGYPGAGKSVLMQVVSGLLHDYNGVLLYNGLPGQNLHLRSLRHHIGDLSQQEDIFKGTVLENISLGRPEVPISKVLAIIEQLGLSDFVESQPQGLNQELLSGGKGISTSIVSRLLIARAIASTPNLLALERPLRSLNLHDRVRIASVLTDHSKPWTLICATEDPIMASVCQRVVVLRDGAIVFDDTYEALMKTEHGENIFRFNLTQSI
jgi:ABC-type bacteriocin/lantibiotic exporter with double-glycine peptidase domain